MTFQHKHVYILQCPQDEACSKGDIWHGVSSSILIDGYHFVRSAQQDYAILLTNYHIYINIICPHDVDVHVLFCC